MSGGTLLIPNHEAIKQREKMEAAMNWPAIFGTAAVVVLAVIAGGDYVVDKPRRMI